MGLRATYKIADLDKKIIFSDEAHFDLGGYVNKENTYIEKPTHPNRVTAWCAFCSRGIIGLFFFENYPAMLNEVLFTKIEKEDLNIWI